MRVLKQFSHGREGLPKAKRSTLYSTTASPASTHRRRKSLSTRLVGPAGQNCTQLCNGLDKIAQKRSAEMGKKLQTGLRLMSTTERSADEYNCHWEKNACVEKKH